MLIVRDIHLLQGPAKAQRAGPPTPNAVWNELPIQTYPSTQDCARTGWTDGHEICIRYRGHGLAEKYLQNRASREVRKIGLDGLIEWLRFSSCRQKKLGCGGKVNDWKLEGVVWKVLYSKNPQKSRVQKCGGLGLKRQSVSSKSDPDFPRGFSPSYNTAGWVFNRMLRRSAKYHAYAWETYLQGRPDHLRFYKETCCLLTVLGLQAEGLLRANCLLHPTRTSCVERSVLSNRSFILFENAPLRWWITIQ